MDLLSPLMAVAQLGTGIVKHQQNIEQDRALRRRKFQNSAYAQYLAGIKNKGTVDVQGRVGRFAGDVYSQAAENTAQYDANFRRRMGVGSGSIAGVRGRNEIGIAASEQVGRERSRLEDFNAATMRQAEEAYAQGQTQFDENISAQRDALRGERKANVTNTLTSMIPMVGSVLKNALPEQFTTSQKDMDANAMLKRQQAEDRQLSTDLSRQKYDIGSQELENLKQKTDIDRGGLDVKRMTALANIHGQQFENELTGAILSTDNPQEALAKINAIIKKYEDIRKMQGAQYGNE